MFKLMLGFAAGYWVATRRATGQALVPDDVKAIAVKYAEDTGLPLVASVDRLTTSAPPKAVPIKGKVQIGPYTVCVNSFDQLVDCNTGEAIEVE